MSTCPTRFALTAVALLFAAAAPAFAAEAPPAAAAGREAELLAVLSSGAGHKEKADACRELGRVGTRAAVAPLAALLPDEKLGHMARYALETIPDPAVDAALRAALGALKGLPRVGVIASIGVRRDAQAAEALAALLADADPLVAAAAARALGHIGTKPAAQALAQCLAGGPAAVRAAAADASLLAADAAQARGDERTAERLCDAVLASAPLPHVRMAATRGLILARGSGGVALLAEQLRSEDPAAFAVALRLAHELPGAKATRALADGLARLPADRQVLLLQALGARGDAAAAPAARAAAAGAATNVCAAAVRTLAQLGDPESLPLFVTLATTNAPDVARAAREGLARFPGPKADAAIGALLARPDAGARSLAIELLGQRRSAGAVPVLLKAAEDQDPAVAAAALKALGDLAGEKELQALVRILCAGRAVLPAAESALGALCGRMAASAGLSGVVVQKAVYGALPGGPSADVTAKVAGLLKQGTRSIDVSNATFGDTAPGVPKSLRVAFTTDGVPGEQTVAEGGTLTFTGRGTAPACAEAFDAALPKASGPARLALLRLLRAAGGPKALAAVRAAAAGTEAEARDTAVRLLCEWPTADALADLLPLARSASDAKVKILAQRGVIRLAQQADLPLATRLGALKDALAAAGRDDERKLALAALGGVPSADALALVTPHLANAGLKEEAALAAVSIAEKLPAPRPPAVAEAMEQAAKATGNAELAQRARALAGR